MVRPPRSAAGRQMMSLSAAREKRASSNCKTLARVRMRGSSSSSTTGREPNRNRVVNSAAASTSAVVSVSFAEESALEFDLPRVAEHFDQAAREGEASVQDAPLGILRGRDARPVMIEPMDWPNSSESDCSFAQGTLPEDADQRCASRDLRDDGVDSLLSTWPADGGLPYITPTARASARTAATLPASSICSGDLLPSERLG